MKASFGIALALVAALGCSRESPRDYGTGMNTVDRKYSKTAEDVWKAAMDSAKSSGLTVGRQEHDALGGEIIAQRSTGEKVTIRVRSLAKNEAEASVRVEPGDRATANQLQEMIAKNLGLGDASGGLFGGNSVEWTYDLTLARSLEAAEGVFRTLKVREIGRQTEGKTWELKGRREDSTPVRISMNGMEEMKTKVSFVSGTGKSDFNREFADLMKKEFDRVALKPAE